MILVYTTAFYDRSKIYLALINCNLKSKNGHSLAGATVILTKIQYKN